MVAFDKSFGVVHLKVNEETRDVMFPDAYDHTDRSTAATVTVVNLQSGDTAKMEIQAFKGGNYFESNSYSRCSFMGYLLT